MSKGTVLIIILAVITMSLNLYFLKQASDAIDMFYANDFERMKSTIDSIGLTLWAGVGVFAIIYVLYGDQIKKKFNLWR